MSKELSEKTYRPGPFSCFPITDPKLREVWAADFKDRIIHHLLVSNIESSWEKIFIHGSYACRKKKGAHKAIKKIKRILRNEKETAYLHVDIRGFFNNINKDVLFEILSRRNRHPDILYLTKLIVFHDPKSDYIIKGNEKILRDVPRHKSLFGVPENMGLPIGNYTSQFFANVYLNELDQYAKRVLKCRHYFRYMDDMVVLDSDIAHLRAIAKSIDLFLKEKLKIELHPKKTIIQNAHKGMDFLGFVMHPEYTLSRKRVVGNIRTKLAQFNKILTATNDQKEIEAVVKKAQAVINSYWGHFKHANCGSLKIKLYEKHFEELKKYLEKPDGAEHFMIKKDIFPKDDVFS